jgi:hypothetical protein
MTPHRKTIPLPKNALPLLGLLTLAVLAFASPAAAHQCVDVTITAAPTSAAAGSQIAVAGTVRNCGDPADAFEVSWVLAGQGRRIPLSQKLVTADPGQTVAITDTLFLPSSLPAGDYTLGLIGVAPSGFTDSDSRPLTIE